jgi:hypothetical protein
MPCPYFEPRQVAMEPTHLNARLPLIDEFDGVCRASAEPLPVPQATRMRLCNHGNAGGQCGQFPVGEIRTSFRFDVVRRSSSHLDVLFVEESLFAPLAWRPLTFLIGSDRLDPDPGDACQRAQLLAFCRSYLRHYPA